MGAAIFVMLLAPLLLFGALALGFLLDLVLAFPLMWAWNHAVPAVFGLPALSYWQAFSLLVVASLLVKSTQSCSSKSKD